MVGKRSSNASQIAINIFFIIVSICFVYPILLLISISLSDMGSIVTNGYRLIPERFSLQAYRYVFAAPDRLITGYKVTILTTVLGTSISLLITSLLAYALSKRDYVFRSKLSFFVLFTMLFNGGMVPWYMLITNYLHLKNKIWVLILPYLVNAWNVIMLRTFFQQIPQEMTEAVNGCVGGVWTAGLLSCILDVEGKGGLMAEIKNKLDKENATTPRPRGHKYNFLYDAEKMKALVERMCLDAGVDILLYSRVVDVICEQKIVKGVIVENVDGRKAYLGEIIIDCTGNGDVAAFAGCSFDIGHPETGQMQPASLQSIVVGVPKEFRFMETYEEKRNFYTYLREHGIETTGKTPTIAQMPYGETYIFTINHEIGVRFDSASDISMASIRARQELDSVFTALKKVKGWENLQLVKSAAHVGIREGRRINGLYKLTIQDITNGRKFDDAICLVRFAVDIHALDKKATHGYGNEGVLVKPYNIPYRSLVAIDKENLGLAGRCISGDFYAHASYRVTGDSVPTGEAIGYAATIAIKNKCKLSEVDGLLVSQEMKLRGYEI